MIDILPSLMKLFATVSALILTFLIILYNAIKSRINISKQNVINEIARTIGCRQAKNGLEISKEDKLVIDLLDECYHDRVNETLIGELLTLINTKIDELRNSNIKAESDEEAGKRAKLASHIERDHKNDLEEAMKSYKNSKQFYSIFPTVSYISIGVPILLSLIYFLTYVFSSEIIEKIGNWWFKFGLVLSGTFGFIFIFGVVVYTIQKLRSIDF